MLPVAQLTGTALVTEALEELRAATAGDTLDTTDGAKGLVALNRMIDTSNITRGNIMVERRDQWTLTIGKQTYTIGNDPAAIGTPADLTPADRPIRLVRANLLLTSGSSTIRRIIRLLTKQQWQAKVLQSTPGMPLELYNDEGYPRSTYSFYQTPDLAYVVETYSWQQFQPLATLAGVISIPPGYYEFWLYSLVMRLAGPFGKTPSATTIQLWKDAKTAVELLNSRSLPAQTNGDFAGTGDGLYNWLSGEVE